MTIDEDVSGLVTPRGVLAAAGAILDEEGASQFLVQALKKEGWSQEALNTISACRSYHPHEKRSGIHFFIERFATVADNMDSFIFQDWAQLAICWDQAMKLLLSNDSEGHLDDVVPVIHRAEQIWLSPLDQRCIRFWMVGNLWQHLELVCTSFDTIEAWFEDFTALPACERERPRKMWHDAHECAMYEALPQEFLLQRGFCSNPLQEKLSCQGVAENAFATVRAWRARCPYNLTTAQNHVVTRLFLKSSIIGLKRVFKYGEGYHLYAVTAPWACSGLD
ncbi:MAG: hypothetical protein WCO94_02795 [Verrucomicrobiota bacterium]